MIRFVKSKWFTALSLAAILLGGYLFSHQLAFRKHAWTALQIVHAHAAHLPAPIGRQYGWDQLAAILTRDGDQRNWQTWSSKCYLAEDIVAHYPTWRMKFTSACDSVQNVNLSDPALTATLKTATIAPQAGDNPFRPASVFFNSIAVKSINERGWNLPLTGSTTLDPLILRLAPGAAKPPSVKFMPGSIIVKAIWEAVNDENSTWPLRVYDNSQPQWKMGTGISPPQSLDQVEGNQPGTGWPTLIKLDINEKDPKPCPYKDGDPPSDIPLKSTVPISCFIAHKITRDMYTASLLGNMAGHRQGSFPFYLVLVGLNISTRDADGWNFTTLWWTNNPKADPTHADRPPGNLSAKYTQFAMGTDQDGEPIHNPYLEGPQGKTGMTSNCETCHRLAEVRVDKNSGQVIQSQSNIGLPGQVPNPISDYWQNSIATDAVWTLATARDPQALLLAPPMVRRSKSLKSSPQKSPVCSQPKTTP